jgi:hypothetical protein
VKRWAYGQYLVQEERTIKNLRRRVVGEMKVELDYNVPESLQSAILFFVHDQVRCEAAGAAEKCNVEDFHMIA